MIFAFTLFVSLGAPMLLATIIMRDGIEADSENQRKDRVLAYEFLTYLEKSERRNRKGGK